jgi:hypothetical protein
MRCISRFLDLDLSTRVLGLEGMGRRLKKVRADPDLLG